MRHLIAILAVLIALPLAADDGFALGLTEMDFSASPAEGRDDSVLGPLEADGAAPAHDESLVYRAALTPRDPSERALALWNSDLGRVHWALAGEHSMLGREGLVNGGRMVGLGLATTAVGDGSPGGVALALGRGNWAEMNANQKLQAGIEASFLVALLYLMVAAAD